MKLFPDKFLLPLILLLSLNVFSFYSLPYKLDLTASQVFSLSESTKKVIGGLDEPATVKVFASGNLPPRFLLLKQSLKDLLEEYRLLSHGKVRVEWLAPDKNPAAADLAEKLGIPQLQFSSIQEDKFQVSQGVFGLAVLFEDKKEILPMIENEFNLEYQLASSLLKISQKQRPLIGLTQGHGEVSQAAGTAFLGEPLVSRFLSQQFLVENFTLTDKTTAVVPGQFEALLIIGPKEPFDASSRFALDQFIMQGKPVLFFLDGVEVDENLRAQPAKHNLFVLLEKYKLRLKQNLVLDPSAAVANFNSGLTNFFMPYPYWVKVVPEGINQNHPASFGLQGLVMPWASSIEVPENTEGLTTLVRSSSESWTAEEDFNLNPTQNWQPGKPRAQNLAVLLNGPVTSAFGREEIPSEFNKETWVAKTDKAKIFLAADADMLSDNIAGGFPPNLHLLLKMVEFLTASENLSQIQVKQQDIRPLMTLNSSQTERIKYAMTAGLPLLVVFLGLGYLYWRGKAQFRL